MHRLVLCVAALVPLGLLSPAVSAQWDRDHDRDRGNYGTVYQQTCTDAHWEGSVLRARCQKQDGGWRDTSIDSRTCGGQILNIDGRLSCGAPANEYQGQAPYQQAPPPYPQAAPYPPPPGERGYMRPPDDQGYNGPADGWQGGLPPGDYQLTCQNIRVDGDKLYASCQKRDGEWRNSRLDFDDCRSPIINDNGRLRCSR